MSRNSRRNSLGGTQQLRRDADITDENVHEFSAATLLPPPKPFTPKNWKRPDDTLYGYTGYYERDVSSHELEEPLKKYVIRGYSGFIPKSRHVCGAPAVPSEAKQMEMEREKQERRMNASGAGGSPSDALASARDFTRLAPEAQSTAFRSYARNMNVAERYEAAVDKLLARGQSQEMLLRMVQAKISERVRSYAEQYTGLRKLFEAFDINGDGVLDEEEFRECLERCNIQFDDVQVLSLFAYFDGSYCGHISWEKFAHHASVVNPRGGTAVLPKSITATFKSDWDNVGPSRTVR